jgi:hypothetical protein
VARSRLSLEAFYKIAGLLAISRRMMRLQKSSYTYTVREALCQALFCDS